MVFHGEGHFKWFGKSWCQCVSNNVWRRRVSVILESIQLTIFVFLIDKERRSPQLGEAKLEVVMGIVQVHNKLSKLSRNADDGFPESLKFMIVKLIC